MSEGAPVVTFDGYMELRPGSRLVVTEDGRIEIVGVYTRAREIEA